MPHFFLIIYFKLPFCFFVFLVGLRSIKNVGLHPLNIAVVLSLSFILPNQKVLHLFVHMLQGSPLHLACHSLFFNTVFYSTTNSLGEICIQLHLFGNYNKMSIYKYLIAKLSNDKSTFFLLIK